MSLLLWILVGLLLYTSLAMALDARGLLPPSFKVSGPLLTIHTKRGRAFLDRLSAPKRFWRAWGNLGVGIAVVVMVGSFVAILVSAYGTLTEPEMATGFRPQDALVIPGVNQFLPLEAAVHIVIGLIVGLVVHEGGHGLLCRVENIDIESMGVALLAFIPLGAFVQPDETSQQEADRGGKTRMFAAGVTNNFLVTVLTFVLLFSMVAAFISVVPGVAVGGVFPGSAASDAGIERGDVITAVGGEPVDGPEAFDAAMTDAEREVTVDRNDAGSVTVQRELLVSRTVVGAPIETGAEIVAVDGETVFTEGEFEAATTGPERVTIETDDGETEIALGAFVGGLADDGPMERAGVPDGPLLVRSIDGEPTPRFDELTDVLEDREPGETIAVDVFVGDDPWDGELERYEVTLESHPERDGARLGVFGSEGTSGLVVDDFGVDPYPADQYHGILGGSSLGEDPVTSFIFRMGAVLVLPFANLIDPGISYNFAGFTSDVASFYEVSGPLGAGVVFALANLLFWTGWINLNLGFFNCIPSYPLDGGHILRSCVEATLARLPVEATSRTAATLTIAISLTMIVSFLGLLFAPQLL